MKQPSVPTAHILEDLNERKKQGRRGIKQKFKELGLAPTGAPFATILLQRNSFLLIQTASKLEPSYELRNLLNSWHKTVAIYLADDTYLYVVTRHE